MLAVVTIESGLEHGRKVWLRHNEVVRVGRGLYADFPVGGDRRLADVHFALHAANDACWLQSAGDDAAIWINGAPVRGEQILEHGDVITAGGTRFRVLIEGPRAVIPAHVSPASPSAASPQSRAVRYREETCASGWPRFLGDAQDHALLDIARLMSQRHQLHLVVNVRNAREPVARNLASGSDLLRHLTDRPLARKQLMLISPTDGVDVLERLPSLLGKDAVSCVFTERTQRELASALRPAVISYSAPSILDAQLATCPAGFVRGILAPASLVLVESQDGRQWHAYSPPASAPAWKELGFPNPPAGMKAGDGSPGLSA